MRGGLIIALLSAIMWPDAARAQEPASTVTVIAGGGVSLSDQSGAIPRVQVTVDSPGFLGMGGDAIGRLRVDLALSGLPGETVEGLRDPTNWTSAELYGEGQRRVGEWGGSETMLVARGGFITRILPGDKEPRQRFARVYTIGVRAQHREDGKVTRSIALMYGRSEVASPDRFHAGQLVVDGHVRLKKLGTKGGEVTIVGDAHLTLGKTHAPGERDVMRLGLAVGWGS